MHWCHQKKCRLKRSNAWPANAGCNLNCKPMKPHAALASGGSAIPDGKQSEASSGPSRPVARLYHTAPSWYSVSRKCCADRPADWIEAASPVRKITLKGYRSWGADGCRPSQTSRVFDDIDTHRERASGSAPHLALAVDVLPGLHAGTEKLQQVLRFHDACCAIVASRPGQAETTNQPPREGGETEDDQQQQIREVKRQR